MSYEHDGVDYDLSIFDTKEHEFKLDSSVSIFAEIHFSVHCYTEEWTSGEVITDRNGNQREFCPIRYSYSKECINQIDDWLKRACLESKDTKGFQHWILVEDANGQKGKVAFDIKKHKDTTKLNGVWITVKTIHPYDKSTPPDLEVESQTTFKKLTKAVGVFNTKPQLKKPKKKLAFKSQTDPKEKGS